MCKLSNAQIKHFLLPMFIPSPIGAFLKLCEVTTNVFGFVVTHQSLDLDFKDLRKLCVGLMKDLYKKEFK
jgi:hypothetical protein